MSDKPEYSPGVQKCIEESKHYFAKRQALLERVKNYKFDTLAVHGPYSVEEALDLNQGALIEPLYLSASQAYRATDLGRIKSVATIPAISTHQQQGEEARVMADVPPQLIRLCVGGEDPADVIADLDQALNSL
jgi:O-acetylhomoserine/O-acetylserine sulfhydrylase-like pyridoxal-dependent enzyme